jgi:phosphoenolpyruvate-protein kinase (PTS system EI component)
MEKVLSGAPASPGVGLGTAWRRTEEIRGEAVVAWEDHERERALALGALESAAQELHEVAAGLVAEEAEIVEAGVLMAQDPALAAAVEEAVLQKGLGAGDAILLATEQQAQAIAALGDETLAARADDVRSLGRRAARLTTHNPPEARPDGKLVLIAHDLGPADVAELASALAGVALVGGGPTAHAAIVARSLGVPMVTGLGPEALEIPDGTPLALDGSSGLLVVSPSGERAAAASEQMDARRLQTQLVHAQAQQPAVTSDGRKITVLANVASAAELEVALRAGAEGIGLLRTELGFLDAPTWPSEQDHTDFLKPILSALPDRKAIVRVLDFGADKSPPFLSGIATRGLELLLEHPDALIRQLRAILLCAHGRDVRILLPLVDAPEQVIAFRGLLERAAAELGIERLPQVGSMIETPRAAQAAPALAGHSDFLSIGTNDLTAATLGADRFADDAVSAHDPRVLQSIARSVRAAHDAGLEIEVCGEAASDPIMLPLLVGLGVDEVSVGAARVGEVRGWIRQLSALTARHLAEAALAMPTAQQVQDAVRSAQRRDGGDQGVERNGRVHALGA